MCKNITLKNGHILILTECYIPGIKGGGPIRTMENTVKKLAADYSFKVVTSNHDYGDSYPYRDIQSDCWTRVNDTDVYYLSPSAKKIGSIKQLLSVDDFDLFYLNSFFSINFTIKPLILRKLGLIPDRPIVLAPRGELSPGALSIKKIKKNLYIKMSALIGLYKGIIWQASSDYEKEDIQRQMGKSARIIVAPDISCLSLPKNKIAKTKRVGYLKLFFLSRITGKKNLEYALERLFKLNGDVNFDIYGPIEDHIYWKKCLSIIRQLPDNIKVQYLGIVNHNDVIAMMGQYDFFFLPTYSENFGHVILEAIIAGCPLIISDQTPWRDLEKRGVGWDIPLSEPETFEKMLQRCVGMDDIEYQKRFNAAQDFGRSILEDRHIVEKTRLLFRKVIEEGKKARCYKI